MVVFGLGFFVWGVVLWLVGWLIVFLGCLFVWGFLFSDFFSVSFWLMQIFIISFDTEICNITNILCEEGLLSVKFKLAVASFVSYRLLLTPEDRR